MGWEQLSTAPITLKPVLVPVTSSVPVPVPISKLSQWVTEATEGENRELAKERIAYCYNNKSSSLHLQSLHLKELPDIFHHRIFKENLKVLNLVDNTLTSLPQCIELSIDIYFSQVYNYASDQH